MDRSELLRRLRLDGGLLEVSQVTYYKGYRKDRTGAVYEVTVEVWDAGPDVEPREHRFSIRASDDDGRTADGCSAASLEQALTTVRWADLD